jgi:hypothetical protein
MKSEGKNVISRLFVAMVFEKVPLRRALREAGFSASYSRGSKTDLTFAAAWNLVEAEKRGDGCVCWMRRWIWLVLHGTDSAE